MNPGVGQLADTHSEDSEACSTMCDHADPSITAPPQPDDGNATRLRPATSVRGKLRPEAALLGAPDVARFGSGAASGFGRCGRLDFNQPLRSDQGFDDDCRRTWTCIAKVLCPRGTGRCDVFRPH